MLEKNIKTIVEELYQIIHRYNKVCTMGIISYKKDGQKVLFEYFMKDNQWVEKINNNEKFIKQCIENEKEIIVNNYIDSSFTPEIDKIRSVYYSPIFLYGKVTGIFILESREKDIFIEEVIKKLFFIKRMIEALYYKEQEKKLLRETNDKVKKLLRQRSIVKEASKALISTSSVQEISQRVYNIMRKNYGECAIGIFINDEDQQRLKDGFCYEYSEKLDFGEIPYSRENSFILESVFKNREVIKEDIINDEKGILVGANPDCIYCAPLRMREELIGAFTYQIYGRAAFEKEELDICRELISFLTIALNNTLERQKLEESNNLLKEYSERDHLTGLCNRRHFYNTFEKKLKISKSDDGKVFIFLFDLDDFKGVNDNFGHIQGDVVLQKVASILKAEIKEGYIARYGGDEFIGGMQCCDEEIPKLMIKNIIRKIEELGVQTNREGGELTVSVGVLVFSPRKPIKSYFEMVDQALYLAKKTGKNKMIFKEYID